MEVEAVSSAINVETTPGASTAALGTNKAVPSETNSLIPAEELKKAKVSKTGKLLLKRGPRGPREDPNHPRTAEMVNTAILTLNERGGSSIQAIKKYIADAYKIDTKKKALFIKKYLISAVEAGVLYRTRGAGAAGSFQISKRRKGEIRSKSKTKDEIVPETVNAKKTAIVKKPTSSAKTNLTKKTKDKKKNKSNTSTVKSSKSTSKSKAASAATSSPKKMKVAPKKETPSDKPKKTKTTKAVSKKI